MKDGMILIKYVETFMNAFITRMEDQHF